MMVMMCEEEPGGEGLDATQEDEATQQTTSTIVPVAEEGRIVSQFDQHLALSERAHVLLAHAVARAAQHDASGRGHNRYAAQALGDRAGQGQRDERLL